MKSVIEVLEELESVGGRLAKEDILDSHVSNDLLKRFFVAALDPYVDYGVRKFKKPEAAVNGIADDTVVTSFLELLEKFAVRELTGNAAKDEISGRFFHMTKVQQKWCERLLLKNLRCGVQDSTINKTWPNLIVGFEVALAKTLSTSHDKTLGIQILDEVNYPVRIEPKLDGLRCIAIKSNGEVTMFTRNGTPLDTLPTVKAALENSPFDNIVLDGEAMGADWNESASVLMSKKTKKDDKNIVYNVFDCVLLQDWRTQTCDEPYEKRLMRLLNTVIVGVPNAPIKLVPGKTVENEEQLMKFYSETMGHGFEGIMLKDLKAPYRFKRSDAILKMKPVVTYEGVVVGNYGGRVGTKREGMFGGFEIVLPNGIVTRLGGGFNDALRAEIDLAGPDTFNKRIVEIEGQPDPMTKDGLTVDGKVRFPVFMRFRDANDVDRAVIAAGEKFSGVSDLLDPRDR